MAPPSISADLQPHTGMPIHLLLLLQLYSPYKLKAKQLHHTNKHKINKQTKAHKQTNEANKQTNIQGESRHAATHWDANTPDAAAAAAATVFCIQG